jgi:hypothetical protein
MQITSLFRTILLSGLALSLISIIAGFSLVDTLPTILQSYLSQEEASDTESNLYILALLGLLALLIVSIVGLWKFKPWARTLYVGILIIIVPISPTFGPVVMNGWEAMFSDLSFMLDGVLIAMMFSGEISKKFAVQAK